MMTQQARGKNAILAGIGAVATILTSCASPLPASHASDGPAAIEHASADDCAIIAEIGKSELHWSATNAPQASFYPGFQTPDGGTYLEDCPWKNLGLAEPQIGAPNSPMGFFITRPVYSGAGANAYYQYSVGPVAAPNGKKISPFVEQELCTLEKDANGWHLVRCKMTAIT
jgi:hypothetical protein